CVIFINQIRMKIGIVFGSPETTTGGNALKFYSSVRLDIRRVESLKKGEDIIGNHVKVKVVKNKMASPFKVAEFDILFDQGIPFHSCLLDAAAEIGAIQKSGTWYSYGDEKIGQGKENAKDFLIQNPDKTIIIESLVRKHYGILEPQKITSNNIITENIPVKEKKTKKTVNATA
ncbi:MAG: DNA recombination/repair protein RecA, partial [Spirochaetota bacterium]|nr:DNA recombination/repair protein RecA [Spirochaetota bacterium]